MTQPPGERAATRIYLPSVRASVRIDGLLGDEELRALVVEDLCWVAAQHDWFARRPHSWQRVRLARWQAEGRLLDEQRDQLRRLARRCGILAG